MSSSELCACLSAQFTAALRELPGIFRVSAAAHNEKPHSHYGNLRAPAPAALATQIVVVVGCDKGEEGSALTLDALRTSFLRLW